MRKNVAGQTVAFQMNSATDGSPVTSGTPTVYYTIDGGTQATGGGTATHKGNGQWSYAPLQSETNGNHVAFTLVLSGAITQTVNVYPVSFDPTDPVRLGLSALPSVAAGASGGIPLSVDANGRVDIGKWKGSIPADLTDTDKIPSSIQHASSGVIVAADMQQISGDSTAADSLESALDGTGGVTIKASIDGSVSGSVGSVSSPVTVGTNNDKSGYSIASTGLNGVTLPANIISADALSAAAVAKIEAALLNEGDGQALIDAIVQAIDAADIDADILPGLIRDAILNRTLAGNHDTAGTVGALLQYLDAAVSTRLASSGYTAPLDSTQTQAAAAAAIEAYAPPTKSEMDAALDPIASDASDAKDAAEAVQEVLGELTDDNSSGVAQFTEDALANAPSGGGGGGGDATLAKQDEILDAINALSVGNGSGAHRVPFTIRTTGGTPIPEADIIVTNASTLSNASTVGTDRSDANGNVEFYLDPGNYWMWGQKAGTNFDNPQTFTVDANGDVS